MTASAMTTLPAMSLRERILQVTAELVQQQPVKSLRVQDICAAAGISRTSFYREFSNIDDVIGTHAIQRWRRTMTTVITGLPTATTLERWRQLLGVMTRLAASKADGLIRDDSVLYIIGLMYKDDGTHLKELIAVLRPMIEQARAEGVFRNDLSVEDIADWVLRQSWVLASVPLPGSNPDADLQRYIDLALAAVQKPAAANDQLLTEIRQLGTKIDALIK